MSEQMLGASVLQSLRHTCHVLRLSLGCRSEGMAVTSPVHLEIAPLDLTPWPSTTSSVGRLGSVGRQASLAPQLSVVREHYQEQVNRRQVWHHFLKQVQGYWHSASVDLMAALSSLHPS